MSSNFFVQKQNIDLDSLMQEINDSGEVATDLIPYLKKDLEKSSVGEFDWASFNEKYSNEVLDTISSFIPLSFGAILFLILSVFMPIALGFLAIVIMYMLILYKISKKELLSEQQINEKQTSNPVEAKNELWVEVEQIDNFIHILMKQEGVIMRQKVIPVEETETLQDTVIQWEEDIKQYNEKCIDIKTQQEEYANTIQNELDAVTSTFDPQLTKIDLDKPVSQTCSNQQAKNRFLVIQSRYIKILKGVKVLIVIFTLGLISIMALNLTSSPPAEVRDLYEQTQKFTADYYQQHKQIPSKETTENFIKTKNSGKLPVDISLSLYESKRNNVFPNFQKGYYIRISPKGGDITSQWVSWGRKKNKIVTVQNK